MSYFSRLKGRLFYGWVVVIAIFIIMATLGGAGFSFGVFFKPLSNAFNLSRATTSSIFSLCSVLSGLVGLLGGWAIDKYGPRIIILLMSILTGLSLLLTSQTSAGWQLFMTYSLLLALGIGPIYVASMSTVLRWFDKKRGLAIGIASSGGNSGQVIMSPLAAFLITNFDWRIAYIVIGSLAWLIAIPLSRLLKRDPREIGALPDGVKLDTTHTPQQKIGSESGQPAGLSLRQVLRTKSFWLMMLVWLLFSFSMLLIVTHIVPHATDIGITAVKAATILSLFGGMAIAGRVLLGTLSDKIGRKLMAVICALIQAGAMVWLAWAGELWMLYLFAAVFGFTNGGAISCITALIGDTFGLYKIGTILGVLEIAWGIGAATGPIVGGRIFDMNHNYFIAFLLAAVALVVAALMIALIRREMKENYD